MARDPRAMLRDAALPPNQPVDPSAVLRRADQLRRRQRIAGIAAALIVVAVIGSTVARLDSFGVDVAFEEADHPPAADPQPMGTPTPARNAESRSGTSGPECAAADRDGVPRTTDSVHVFFGCSALPDDAVVPVDRQIEEATVEAAVRSYLQGPTGQERSEGFWFPFSGPATGLLSKVEVEDGVATLNFNNAVDGLSGHARNAELLLAGLDATVFQFPQVDAAVYHVGGQPEPFCSLLRLPENCATRTRQAVN